MGIIVLRIDTTWLQPVFSGLVKTLL